MDRRAFLGSLLAIGATAACQRAGGEPGKIRVGFLANMTAGPVIMGLANGHFAAAMGSTSMESRTFRAGPRVCEALLGRAIDVGICGALPVLSIHTRHEGSPLQILGGVASGGASLIVAQGISSPDDLHGRRVATPQLGSTQDVSLRKWLRARGLESKDKGGDVTIDALASPDIFMQMKRGAISGTWLPEPWGTRVVRELPGVRLVDERDLWPRHRFPATVVIVRREFLERRRDETLRMLAAIDAEIERARDASLADENRALVAAEIKRLTIKGVPKPIFDEAWSKVDFSNELLKDEIAQMAVDARDLGYLPNTRCDGLFA